MRYRDTHISEFIENALMPQSIDTELIVLGSLILEHNSYYIISDLITPDCFYHPQHKLIYTAISALHHKNIPVDITTLIDQLRTLDALETIGGVAYILKITSGVSSSSNILFHARIIYQQYLKRQTITLASDTIKEAFNDRSDAFEILADLESSCLKINTDISGTTIPSRMDTIMRTSINELKDKSDNPSHLTGIPSGFSDIDKTTAGFQPGNLIILAARPGVGKTSFMLSIARNAAIDYNKPIAIFSLEMSVTELSHRLISMEAEVEAMNIRSGYLSEDQWTQIEHASISLSSSEIYIDDSGSLTLSQLKSKSRILVKHKGVKMIIVDYLQLLNTDDKKKYGSREQEISTIARSLKALAKQLNVPIIALAQLSREAEKAKKPMLSHLRESGAIEQDADIVMFLHKPDASEALDIPKGLVELIIAKNRHGSVRDIQLRFHDIYSKFKPFIEDDVRSFLDMSIPDNSKKLPEHIPF